MVAEKVLYWSLDFFFYNRLHLNRLKAVKLFLGQVFTLWKLVGLAFVIASVSSEKRGEIIGLFSQGCPAN